MTRCSVQPRDRIFVKSHRFLFFAKNIGKNFGKNKSLRSFLRRLKKLQKLLGHTKNLQHMRLKLLQKKQFKKQQKQLVI